MCFCFNIGIFFPETQQYAILVLLYRIYIILKLFEYFQICICKHSECDIWITYICLFYNQIKIHQEKIIFRLMLILIFEASEMLWWYRNISLFESLQNKKTSQYQYQNTFNRLCQTVFISYCLITIIHLNELKKKKHIAENQLHNNKTEIIVEHSVRISALKLK